MQTLEVSDIRLIAGIDQGFEASNDQLPGTATEDCLFTKEIGLGLFLKRCFQNTSSGAADRMRICKSCFEGFAGRILVYCHQAGNTAALFILPAHEITRSLRRHHNYVGVGVRLDFTVVNVETVRKQECRAFFQAWS